MRKMLRLCAAAGLAGILLLHTGLTAFASTDPGFQNPANIAPTGSEAAFAATLYPADAPDPGAFRGSSLGVFLGIPEPMIDKFTVDTGFTVSRGLMKGLRFYSEFPQVPELM